MTLTQRVINVSSKHRHASVGVYTVANAFETRKNAGAPDHSSGGAIATRAGAKSMMIFLCFKKTAISRSNPCRLSSAVLAAATTIAMRITI